MLEGNLIGTNAAGANLGNELGVVIDGASNNTVGGPVAGTGNTIAFNGFDATHGALTVNVGTGNTILKNLFYANTGSTIATSGIDLTNGGNDVANLPAPVITSVTPSGSGSTNITLNVTGMAAGTYMLDTFSSAPGDSPVSGQVDAHRLLKTFQNVSITAGQTSLTETASMSLSSGAIVTATWTVTGKVPTGLTTGDTSQFATPTAVPLPFVVTTAAASGAGSLAAEITAVNDDTTNSGADEITFELSTNDPNYNPTTHAWTITLNGASGLLPAITHPVIVNATTQAGYAGTPLVVINGSGLAAPA